ncbi:MAG: NADH-quinone oxidoreductase subunit A [Spirochaetia bacterium]|nr:NADH-quinone oxidoreductase subunit A [Spirochaetia bacterium]
MFHSFGPILLQLVLAVGFAAGIIALTAIIGPRKINPVKNNAYECGVETIADARGTFNVKFYLVAVLFILFDVEAIFIIPWAGSLLSFKKAGLGAFIYFEMVFFVAILIAGYVYILKKGALKWE